jgi:hypothetical protein
VSASAIAINLIMDLLPVNSPTRQVVLAFRRPPSTHSADPRPLIWINGIDNGNQALHSVQKFATEIRDAKAFEDDWTIAT